MQSKLLINSDLDKHIQAKTNSERVQRFGNTLAPFRGRSRGGENGDYSHTLVHKKAPVLLVFNIFES